MESAENQVTGNVTASGEERARDLGRTGDNASARLQIPSGETTSQTKNPLGSIGERVKHELEVAGEEAKRKFGVARNRTTTKAKECRVSVEREAQAHPLKSVAYAFGAGALVGLLLGRTRR